MQIYYLIFSHFTAAKKNSKYGNSKEHTSHSAHSASSNSETAKVDGDHNDLEATENKSDSLVNIDEGSDLQKAIPKDAGETCMKETEQEEVELDNLFFEDSSAWEAVAPEILKQQKIEKLSHDGYGHLLGNIDDIWKKVKCFYFFFILMEHVSCLTCASAIQLFQTVSFFFPTTGRFW